MSSYGGKLERIERQIHHYGSGLNSLVALAEFRSNPTDSYLLRVGYGGVSGPLSSIHQDGFAAASFHSWPDTLAWDAYSGDYGPGFLGLVLGTGTYVDNDRDAGLVAYGGILTSKGTSATVEPRDPVRRKIYIGPLGVQISIDAGIIKEFTFDTASKKITVTLSQLDGAPKAASATLWTETSSGTGKWVVTTSGVAQARSGWTVSLSGTATVEIGLQA